jgi:hypothetical protein
MKSAGGAWLWTLEEVHPGYPTEVGSRHLYYVRTYYGIRGFNFCFRFGSEPSLCDPRATAASPTPAPPLPSPLRAGAPARVEGAT